MAFSEVKSPYFRGQTADKLWALWCFWERQSKNTLKATASTEQWDQPNEESAEEKL